jgi:hypothetical protein
LFAGGGHGGGELRQFLDAFGLWGLGGDGRDAEVAFGPVCAEEAAGLVEFAKDGGDVVGLDGFAVFAVAVHGFGTPAFDGFGDDGDGFA